MKLRIFVTVLFLFTINCKSFSQIINEQLTLEQYNYYHEVSTITSSPSQTGGVALPSEGTVNVLFIFAEFPDDNYLTTDSRWPKGGYPDKYNSWVDQTWSTNPTAYSLTDYFNQMSFNKFKFTGKVKKVVAPHTRDWYVASGWTRQQIQQEIIQQLDATQDFAEFDKWTKVSNYQHSNTVMVQGKKEFC